MEQFSNTTVHPHRPPLSSCWQYEQVPGLYVIEHTNTAHTYSYCSYIFILLQNNDYSEVWHESAA